MTPVGVGEGQYDAIVAAHLPSDGICSKPRSGKPPRLLRRFESEAGAAADMDMNGESTAAALGMRRFYTTFWLSSLGRKSITYSASLFLDFLCLSKTRLSEEHKDTNLKLEFIESKEVYLSRQTWFYGFFDIIGHLDVMI